MRGSRMTDRRGRWCRRWRRRAGARGLSRRGNPRRGRRRVTGRSRHMDHLNNHQRRRGSRLLRGRFGPYRGHRGGRGDRSGGCRKACRAHGRQCPGQDHGAGDPPSGPGGHAPERMIAVGGSVIRHVSRPRHPRSRRHRPMGSGMAPIWAQLRGPATPDAETASVRRRMAAPEP